MTMLEAFGGEAGCRRLSAEFYARVSNDSALKRLFPGKTVRCATEEFAAFLIQFLGGDEEQTQKRWWLSLSGVACAVPNWTRRARGVVSTYGSDSRRDATR